MSHSLVRAAASVTLTLTAAASLAACGGSDTAAAPSSTPSARYTLAQVKTHNSAQSCWVAINGNVYNLTNWINQHPGGPDKILGICGTDATAKFTAQHAGESEPQKHLATFIIGTLG